ncbi:MAG: serine/threonine-protein kinase [Patulibacter sp.]|nr:serine/threonine-protein kinase [Patulibacter sp.]
MIAPEIVLPAGTTLAGRYELGSVLGIGGMAIVYEATQIDLERSVAVKVLNRNLAADDAFRRRFRREARLAAALDHPNIVTIHDFGEADEGMYLAMAMIDGETLADRVARERLTAAEAMTILTRLASALDHAHARRLVHGDVKPQNVLLDRANGVYLADFGVAKSLTAAATATTGVMGTVRYVAPEQIRGQQPTPASDLYSLAVVAYECLSGSHPYADVGNASLLAAHLEAAPVRLFQPPGRRPSPINDTFEAGLAKHVAARPSGVGAFVSELEAAMGRKGRARLTRPAFEQLARSPRLVDGWETDADASDTAPIEQSTERADLIDHGDESETTIGRVRARPLWPMAAATASLLLPAAALVTRPKVAVPTTAQVGPVSFQGRPRQSSYEAGARLISAAMSSTKAAGIAATGPEGDVIVGAYLSNGTAHAAPPRATTSRVVQTKGGTLRRFVLGSETIFVGQTPTVIATLVCERESQACETAAATFHVANEELQADPIGTVATRLRDALEPAARSRSGLPLPVHDAAKRSRRARSIATAYLGASRSVRRLADERPRDADLRQLETGLSSGAANFSLIAHAALARSSSRDAGARSKLASSDQTTAAALDRLSDRGYHLDGVGQ